LLPDLVKSSKNLLVLHDHMYCKEKLWKIEPTRHVLLCWLECRCRRQSPWCRYSAMATAYS
jgi:hypothetical protein